MAYHSQQVLLLRHEQEKHLDTILKRKEKPEESPQAFTNSVIRQHLDQSSARHIIFILVATPVEEVGRDHDFDWAIIEPSSYRSIIQLSGRVRRHREGNVEAPNVGILQYNIKALKSSCDQCFYRPGYEVRKGMLNTYDLSKLIDTDAIGKNITAIPRISKPQNLRERDSLSDLEHYVIQGQLTQYSKMGPETLEGYLTGSWYLIAIPQTLNPFRQGEETIKLFLRYNSESDCLEFIEKDAFGNLINRKNIYGIQDDEMTSQSRKKLWLPQDYKELLEDYAESNGCSIETLSLRYGELSFIHRENQSYVYSDDLGLTIKREGNI